MSSELVEAVTKSVEKATEKLDMTKAADVALKLGMAAIAVVGAVAGYALYKGGIVKTKFWNVEFEADTRSTKEKE